MRGRVKRYFLNALMVKFSIHWWHSHSTKFSYSEIKGEKVTAIRSFCLHGPFSRQRHWSNKCSNQKISFPQFYFIQNITTTQRYQSIEKSRGINGYTIEPLKMGTPRDIPKCPSQRGVRLIDVLKRIDIRQKELKVQLIVVGQALINIKNGLLEQSKDHTVS